MDEKIKELAAIAAAIAGKYQPCFAHHLKQAKGLGISDELIREVVQLAKDIRASGNKTWTSLRNGA